MVSEEMMPLCDDVENLGISSGDNVRSDENDNGT